MPISSPPPTLRAPIRVGLLGAGGIADAHAQALTSLDGVELVAVADIDRARAGRLTERWHAGTAFSSLEEMVAAHKPDVVHILLPPELHAPFAIRAMASGAHVFIEKPACVSAAECDELEAAAARFNRVAGVNHNITFEPAYRRLIELVRECRLGAIQHVTVFWSVPFGLNTFDAPLFKREGPGAVILESGPHPLSLIVRLVGEARTASALVSAEMQANPDTWQIALACQRGTAQCFIGIGRSFTDTRVHVIGEDGCALVDLRLGQVALVENTRFSTLFFKFGDSMGLAREIAATAWRDFLGRLRRIPVGGACDDGGRVMRASIADFYQALRTGRNPTASLAEGLGVVRSCLRIITAGQRNVETREVDPCRSATASS